MSSSKRYTAKGKSISYQSLDILVHLRDARKWGAAAAWGAFPSLTYARSHRWTNGDDVFVTFATKCHPTYTTLVAPLSGIFTLDARVFLLINGSVAWHLWIAGKNDPMLRFRETRSEQGVLCKRIRTQQHLTSYIHYSDIFTIARYPFQLLKLTPYKVYTFGLDSATMTKLNEIRPNLIFLLVNKLRWKLHSNHLLHKKPKIQHVCKYLTSPIYPFIFATKIYSDSWIANCGIC